jgi:hypothetical protein
MGFLFGFPAIIKTLLAYHRIILSKIYFSFQFKKVPNNNVAILETPASVFRDRLCSQWFQSCSNAKRLAREGIGNMCVACNSQVAYLRPGAGANEIYDLPLFYGRRTPRLSIWSLRRIIYSSACIPTEKNWAINTRHVLQNK